MISTDKYLDIPYVDHGRSVDGLDCWGLVWLVYKNEFGIDLPSWSAAYENADKTSFRSIKKRVDCFSNWREVDRPQPGDVATFNAGGNFHVGICLDKYGMWIMHIMRGSKVTRERVTSLIWRDRLQGYYRYAG